MEALIDYDSGGDSERDYPSSEPPDEAPEQPQMLPDIEAITREMRAEIEQARLKADKLICRFAEAYVQTAGQIREEAIQRYRGRLERLPAEVCAEVCETLAKDDRFCCNMEYGNGHLSHGGMSFTYKVESDAAFNALSHHAWKDLHQLFVKIEPPAPLGNALKQGPPSLAHLIDSGDDEDGLEPHKDRSPSSSKESDLLSDVEDSLSSEDSTGALRRPPNGPWSADEEALIREMMATQLQMQSSLVLTERTATKFLEFFPGRTISAIKNKWRALKTRDTRDDWGRAGGKLRVSNATGKVRVEDTERKKLYEEGSVMEYSGVDNDFNDREVKRGSHDILSRVKNEWTPEQDQLLADRMHSEMLSSGVATMPVPSAIQKELARSFGRKERAISRRWLFLSGQDTWKMEEERRKKENGSIPAKNEPKREGQAPASSSRPPPSDTPRQSESAEASGLRRRSRPNKDLWSPQEVEALIRLTKGLHRNDIDFKKVAAQLSDPSRRTADACRTFWTRNVQSLRPMKDQTPIQDGEATEKSADCSSKTGPPGRHIRRRADPRLGPKPGRESLGEADTVNSGVRGSKHARESGDESEKRTATRRRRHHGVRAQSSLRGHDHDDGSEAEDFDVYMCHFE